jgi:hypothetical protein
MNPEDLAYLVWPLFGALIGISASRRKGFSTAGGIIGGLLLGLLSPLMFLVSAERRKCPGCDEWISRKASICPKCRTTIGALAKT